MSDPDFQAIDQRIVAAADPAAAVESNLHALCNEIGPRFAGTDGYRKAAVYMQDRLEAYGLENAHLEPFEIAAFRRGSQPARVMADGFEAAAYGLPYGAATGPEGLKTTVIHVGGGSESDLADRADQLSGCLVLTTGPGRVRQEIYAQCVELGAGGLIRSNPIEGDHLHTGSVTHGQMGPIPAVSVSQKTGEALRQRVEAGDDQFCLTVGGHCETVTTWNVVGELPGCGPSGEQVIVGGHLDSHDIGPGAYDNGVGAVMVMEIARLLAGEKEHLQRKVRFVGFAAEEIGLLGSHHHARAHADELPETRVMFNCDMPGLRPPWVLVCHRCSALEGHVQPLSDQIGVDLTCRPATHRFSDHYPFTKGGVPALALQGKQAETEPGRWRHMAGDTADKIPVDGVAEAASIAARIILRAASDPDWPDARSQ